MFRFKRTFKINGRPVEKEYIIYAPNEECPHPVKYWRDLMPGDENEYWAIDDEGYKGEVRSVKAYHNRFQKKDIIYVNLSYARSFTNYKAPIAFPDRLKNRSFSMLKDQPWHEAELAKALVQKVIKIYAQMLMTRGVIDWKVLGKIYRPNLPYPQPMVKRLFKTEGVKKMVDEEVSSILKGMNIDKEWVLKKAVRAMALAEANNDPKTMLNAIPFFEKHLKMVNEIKTKQTEMLQYDFNHLDKEIQSAEKLKLERTTETTQNIGALNENSGSDSAVIGTGESTEGRSLQLRTTEDGSGFDEYSSEQFEDDERNESITGQDGSISPNTTTGTE